MGGLILVVNLITCGFVFCGFCKFVLLFVFVLIIWVFVILFWYLCLLIAYLVSLV